MPTQDQAPERAGPEKPAAVPTTPRGRPAAYPPEAVLTFEDIAEWLGVSVRTVQRWPLKRSDLGDRTPRVLAKWVYEYLESRAA